MTDQFESHVRDFKAHETEVLLSKHHDYGPKNIADSPGGPVNGLRVRLHDKLARINNLIDAGADPNHEGLIDTALDIANYGTILALVLSGEWPGTEQPNVARPRKRMDELDPRRLVQDAFEVAPNPTPWWAQPGVEFFSHGSRS